VVPIVVTGQSLARSGAHVVDEVAAELLRVSGSNYADVDVRTLALPRLFAPLLMALGDAAAMAITCRTGLTLYSGWRTGSRHQMTVTPVSDR